MNDLHDQTPLLRYYANPRRHWLWIGFMRGFYVGCIATALLCLVAKWVSKTWG